MRLLSFHADNTEQFGAIVDGRVVSLSERMPEYATLRQVLEAGALVRAQDIAASSSADYHLKEIKFRPPITQPGKIVCISGNYAGSIDDTRHAGGIRSYPGVVLRTPETLVGHLEPLLKPPESDQYDYEGNIVLIIGREGRRIPQTQALAHIAGITLMNQGAVRDWSQRGGCDATAAKNFEKSGAMGPWLVTADELSAGANLQLTTRVNGEIRQHAETANMHFPFDQLISYLSIFLRLRPGDVIATGTPSGAGIQLNPPQFLQPGDRVAVEVPDIGTLENTVEAEVLADA